MSLEELDGEAARSTELMQLVSLSRETTRLMRVDREDADRKAREAIAAVESRLLDALGGEVLRGLPNLGDRVFGLRVGCDGSAFAKIPSGGRHVLVLDAHGRLGLASRPRAAVLVQVPPPSVFVVASILAPYLHAVARAAKMHLEASGSRAASFRAVGDLAGKVLAALM